MFKFRDFKLNSQLALMSTIGFVILILGVSSIISSQKSLTLAKKVDVATSQYAEINSTKDDLSRFEIRLFQWVHGDISREEVQKASTILIQRLDAQNPTGISLAQRAIPGFLTALRNAEEMLAGAPRGFLPAPLQNQYRYPANQILEISESAGNRLIIDYRNIVTAQIQSYIVIQRAAVLRNLYLQLASRLLAIFFITWFLIRSYRRNIQRKLELKGTQQRLQEVRANLGTAHEVVASLRQENREKTEIISTVNHELRTPLTSIIGYVDILKDFSVTENEGEFKKYLGIMERNAAVLLELVESILSFSALNSREGLTDTSVIDIVERCEKCVASLYLRIENSNINVNATYDIDENYTVRGSEALLSQVFTNLISNAIKFSPKDSRIDITFSRTLSDSLGEVVRFEIRDYGIGIPEGEIDQLFSSFFRASNAMESDIPGSGLGLAIVKRIIGLHGGEISVRSEVGVGTSMSVDLPLAISPLEAMVMMNREDVLLRAIESLSNSPTERLAETAHEVGGAIGFYTFNLESIEVLDLSRWLERNPHANEAEILSKKLDVINTLSATLARVRGQGDS